MNKKEIAKYIEIGRAIGTRDMADVSIEVFNKLDRETPFEMPMWAYKVLHTPKGDAEDFLEEVRKGGQ